MATAVCSSTVTRIGETAGMVWHVLAEEGPTSVSKLVKQIDEPRDLIMQAIGWLARENKVIIEDTPRGKTIALSCD